MRRFCYICEGAGGMAGIPWRPDRGGYCRDGRAPASLRRGYFGFMMGVSAMTQLLSGDRRIMEIEIVSCIHMSLSGT